MVDLKVVEEQEVLGKTFRIFGDFQNPLFKAVDVAEWIEYDKSSVNKLLAKVDDDEKVRKIVPTLGGNQEMWLLTENGLYETLMLSRKSIAKQFKKEVKRILKGLRLTGKAEAGSSLTQKDIELISTVVSMTVAKTMQALDKRVSDIECKIEERKSLLPPPQLKPREHINMLVRKFSEKSGMDYKDIWVDLYRQFAYRTKSNPSTAAKNRGMKIIDFIETEGQIEVLESIAMEVFG